MERSGARKRDRVLKPDEIRALWTAAPADTFGGIVKMLLLTAQRRDEVGGMALSEIDRSSNWTIRPNATRRKKPTWCP